MLIKENEIDSRNIIYLLATSKYPVKLHIADTLYVDLFPRIKVKDWIYTTPNDYLTIKRNKRVMRHLETLKAFLISCLNISESLPFFDLDV